MEDSAHYEIIKEEVLNLIENSTLKHSITLIEIEHILPSGIVSKKFTLEGRVSKKLLTPLKYGWLNPHDELESQIYDIIEFYSGPYLATKLYEEYWLVSIGTSKDDHFNSLSVNKIEGGEYIIKQQGNETLVIDIWATWCSYCQKPMEHNMDLMQDKQITDLGINIIGVSVDKDLNALKNHLKEKNWIHIPQYNNEHTRKNLQIISIPCVIIINNKSIIKHVGSPNDMLFVESIKNIAKGGEAIIEIFDSVQDNVWWSKLTIEEKTKIVNQINNKMNEEGCSKASFVMTSTYQYEGKTMLHAKCKPGYLGKVSNFEFENLKKFEGVLASKYNLRNVDNKVHVEKLVINFDEDF